MPEEFEGEVRKSLEPPEPENVTGEEYEKALGNLRRFTRTDIEQIQTLDDLTLRLHNVGRDLRAVIVTNGKRHNPGLQESFLVAEPLKGEDFDEGEIRATITGDNVHLDGHKIKDQKYLSNYEVKIPIYRDISVDAEEDRMPSSANDWTILANQWQEGKGGYVPIEDLDNPIKLQGYTRVLKEAVTDLLSVAEPPTEISTELTEGFEEI